MKFSRLLLPAILIFGLLGYYWYKKPKFNDGQRAPNFSFVLENGETINLEDFKGQYVLLDFWGSWCGPCRMEAGDLVSLYDSFHGKKFKDAEDFEIISIGLERSEQNWKRAIQKDNYYWKYHHADFKRMKTDIAVQYGVREIPTKYLIDPGGNVISVNQSFEELAAYLKGKLK